MKIPAQLRKQLMEYKREGFNAIAAEQRKGTHWLITFAEFPQKQIVTINGSDSRAIKNNIANYRRLLKGQS